MELNELKWDDNFEKKALEMLNKKTMLNGCPSCKNKQFTVIGGR